MPYAAIYPNSILAARRSWRSNRTPGSAGRREAAGGWKNTGCAGSDETTARRVAFRPYRSQPRAARRWEGALVFHARRLCGLFDQFVAQPFGPLAQAGHHALSLPLLVVGCPALFVFLPLRH